MGEGPAYVRMLIDEWRALGDLCSSLDESQWRADTDCPGWTVKDVLSHICGTEHFLAGDQRPEHDLAMPAYVRNPLGEMNEIEVDHRRPWPPLEVLEDFRAITARRAGVLAALTEEEFAQPTWTPTGAGTMADLLAARVVDNWLHEQDIRRATGVRDHLDGPIAEFVLSRLTRALPKIVAKDARAADGTVVLFEVSGRPPTAVGVEGGRGSMHAEAPASADARVVMDAPTFVCLAAGRWDAERSLRLGLVEVEGDRELATRILMHMNVMP